MNHYPKHAGDYIRDTVGLSMLEDGAYNRLLDQYYINETPLPLDKSMVYRLARAVSKAERAAVDFVLALHFEQCADGYRQKRADTEIAAYQKRADTARQNGANGGRRKNPERTDSVSSGIANSNPERTGRKTNQEPITKNQEVLSNTVDHTNTSTVNGAGGVCVTPGEACRAMRSIGIADTNPGHLDLIRACDSGASIAEFQYAAKKAKDKGAGFAYAVGVVVRQRERAAKVVLHEGRLPNKQEQLEASNSAVGDEWEKNMIGAVNAN